MSYSCNQMRTVQVICPCVKKFAVFDFGLYLQMLECKQSAPNLVTMYMTKRSRMSCSMVIFRPEYPELFALELGKIAEFDIVYTLASTNINQSVPNFL